MPDLLDRVLAIIDDDQKRGAHALVKTASGYVTVPTSDLDNLYGEMEQIETRPLKSESGEEFVIPVLEQRVTDADKTAQQARATAHGIGAKDSGSVVKPKGHADRSDDDYADPVNYRGLIHDEKHVRDAIAEWADEHYRSLYTADEQTKIQARLDAAAAKHGITPDAKPPDPAPGGSKSALTIDGDTFDMIEEKDGLGRTTYRFDYGTPGADAAQFGFVYRGTLAMLRAPKDTSHEDMQRLLSRLATHKSAQPQRKQGTFADALQDAYEAAGVGALSQGWWAFLSTVADTWEGDFEDIDAATYNDCVDQFAGYLKETWAKFNEDNGTQASVVAQAMDALKLIRRGAGQSKAGAAISSANRAKLDAAAAAIAEVLGKTDTGDTGDTGDKGTTGVQTKGATPDSLAQLHAEVNRLKAGLAEVEPLKGRQKQLEGEVEEWKRKATESEEMLRRFGQLPRPDPLAPDGKTASGTTQNDGEDYTTYGYVTRASKTYGGY